MAVIKWRGDAAGVAQRDVRTIAGTLVAGSSYFQVAIGNKSLRYTLPSTATGTNDELIELLITGFVDLWASNAIQANGIGEYNEVDCASFDTAKIGFTAIVPGVPFGAFTYSAGGGASQSADSGNSVTSSGPNDASVGANYSSGALPSNGDELWFDDASNGPEFGLTALASITLARVMFTQNFTGQVGRPERITVGQTTYLEYRDKYLQLRPSSSSSPIVVNCSSAVMRINTQTYQTLLQVIGTGSPQGDTPALCWLGTHASNAVIVDKGSVGVAFFPGEVSTVLTLRMGYINQVEDDAIVRTGIGVTLGTCLKIGGNLRTEAGLTTLTQRGGTSEITGAITTTATIYAGVFRYRGTSTIAAIVCHAISETYWNESNQTRTCTDTTIYPGATWQDPGATVTHTNAILIPGGSPTQVVGTFGTGRSGSLSFTSS